MCLDPLFRPGRSDSSPGPFDSLEVWSEFLLDDDLVHCHSVKYHWRKLMNNKRHQIYFTHADLSPRNIMVENGHLSGIVDGKRQDGILTIGSL
jgi:hypothetical protein